MQQQGKERRAAPAAQFRHCGYAPGFPKAVGRPGPQQQGVSAETVRARRLFQSTGKGGTSRGNGGGETDVGHGRWCEEKRRRYSVAPLPLKQVVDSVDEPQGLLPLQLR